MRTDSFLSLASHLKHAFTSNRAANWWMWESRHSTAVANVHITASFALAFSGVVMMLEMYQVTESC